MGTAIVLLFHAFLSFLFSFFLVLLHGWINLSERVFSNHVNSWGPEDGSVVENIFLFCKESQFTSQHPC